MNKKKRNFLLIFFFFFIFSNGHAENILNDGAKQVINNLKIEIATKGKKLNKFFSGNILDVVIKNKELQYKFTENNYEIFESNSLLEKGKWKLSGILKNSIKLKPDSKKKSYYLKKISNTNKIYHFDGSPANESTVKTLIEIKSSNKEIINQNEDNAVKKIVKKKNR